MLLNLRSRALQWRSTEVADQEEHDEAQLREAVGSLELEEAAMLRNRAVVIAAAEERETLQALEGRLAEESARLQSARLEAEQEEARLQQSARSEEESSAAAVAGEAAAARRLEDLSAAEGRVGTELEALETQQQQLAVLLHGLEATRTQATNQLQDVLGELAHEEKMLEEVTQGPAGARTMSSELAAEDSRLRAAIKSLDAERSELERVAASKAQELKRLRGRAAELRSARTDLQWSLDRLRHAVDLGHGELAGASRKMEAATREFEVLENEAHAARTEAAERRRDAALGLDDLLHMTRENQLLHDELSQTRRQHDVLVTRLEEHRAQHMPRIQAVRGAEMECENMIWAYRQVLEDRQRNEAAIAEAACQADRAKAEAGALEERIADLRRRESEAREASLLENSRLAAVRARLSGTARSLEMHELAVQTASVGRERLRERIGLRQAATSQAYMGESAANMEAEELSAEVEALQLTLRELQVSVTGASREKEEIYKQRLQLQDAIAQLRQGQQRVEAENITLKKLLGEAGQGDPGPADASVVQSQTALRRTLAQQEVLLAQMEAERKGLSAEVESLRAELIARDGAGSAGPSDSAGGEPSDSRPIQ
mmetsp:Transcript_62720/g.136223  ORF Transcript_62720/g.136223 Transcript_62720/m.136223 type:complete len:606 (-) Transcript_62720:47-1864(-)